MTYDSFGEIYLNSEENKVFSYFNKIWKNFYSDEKINILGMAYEIFEYYEANDKDLFKYFILASIYEYVLIKMKIIPDYGNFLKNKDEYEENLISKLLLI